MTGNVALCIAPLRVTPGWSRAWRSPSVKLDGPAHVRGHRGEFRCPLGNTPQHYYYYYYYCVLPQGRLALSHADVRSVGRLTRLQVGGCPATGRGPRLCKPPLAAGLVLGRYRMEGALQGTQQDAPEALACFGQYYCTTACATVAITCCYPWPQDLSLSRCGLLYDPADPDDCPVAIMTDLYGSLRQLPYFESLRYGTVPAFQAHMLSKRTCTTKRIIF